MVPECVFESGATDIATPKFDAAEFVQSKVPYMALVRQRPVVLPTKIDVLQALFYQWQRVPEQRLGQLLENTRMSAGLGKDLFYVADTDLVVAVEKFVEETTGLQPDAERTTQT